MSDDTNTLHPVAGMNKAEIMIAIEAAPVAELADIDATLATIGYAADGVLRTRIAARLNPSPEV